MVKTNIIWAPQIAENLGIKITTMYEKDWKDRTRCPLRKIGSRLGAKVDEYERWFENYGALVNGTN